jgi:signal transduction histidine kinase/ActR/RegA family two-component response regulator
VSDAALDGRVLVVAPTGRDAALSLKLLADAGIEAHACAGVAAMCVELERGAAVALIAEEALVPQAIARLATALANQPPWSDLPLVVFTSEGAIQRRQPTQALLAPLGNVTLLDRPVRPITMVAAVQAALRARARQYEARGEIARQQRALRERDQFLAMLGHELRNPLGAILLAGEMLPAGGEAGGMRDVILRQVRHLARLVDDLLDVARVTTGKVVLHRAALDLNELVARCVRLVEPAARAQGLTLALHAGTGDATVDGDAVRLDQVLTNLLTNAIKYTAAGGRIDVHVTAGGGHVEIRVRDTGVGISAEMLPRVFELFAQAEGSLDRSQGGLGIGLTLVQRLVELHGGSVSAASDGLGKGSEFAIKLPRRASPRRDAAAQSEPPETESAKHVLIVEDNQDTRELLQMLIAGFGHRVEVAADGEEGVALAARLRPDVMIIDLGLPRLDGFGVARRVRADLGNAVVLVALTGYGQPEDRRRALEAGFDAHFIKPIEPRRLQRLLADGLPGAAAS